MLLVEKISKINKHWGRVLEAPEGTLTFFFYLNINMWQYKKTELKR